MTTTETPRTDDTIPAHGEAVISVVGALLHSVVPASTAVSAAAA